MHMKWNKGSPSGRNIGVNIVDFGNLAKLSDTDIWYLKIEYCLPESCAVFLVVLRLVLKSIAISILMK
jgi:hypothetical protein